jgi:superfamily II DNA or RNA helicase
MSTVFPADLRFAHPWREYQSCPLAELDPHLSDGHLHVVAAPGAGKTILGLEVMRRLGRPALVVAPTITIRNQWCERFEKEFGAPDLDLGTLVSRNLDSLAPMTVTTYQALHAAMDNEALRNRLLGSLGRVGTLVLDEAHHLHHEWWKALIGLKTALDGITVLSLTATPPFDVTATQWNRYIELCGPIDAEISVLELVATGDLCPHQDQVFLCLPDPVQRAALRERRADLDALRDELQVSQDFVRSIVGHPQFVGFDTDTHREAVLADPTLFCAMVIVAHAAAIDCAAQRNFLGAKDVSVPAVADQHLERILGEMLFGEGAEQFDADDRYRATLRARLNTLGAIERRQVRFDGGAKVQRRLRASTSKLGAIADIHSLEASAPGDNLRMVVLTDHVRREDLGREDKPAPQRMGAVPIFERLRTTGAQALCLLTGGLIILPRDVEPAFAARLAEAQISPPRAIPHPHELNFVLFNINNSLRQGAVAAVTRLFNDGKVRTIVGTAALLAEGWDAQSANTLIIASAVSTHMLSNQMRGRVIRVDRAHPDKASNIWHLACIEPDSIDGGGDFQSLQRRFSAFQGVCYDGKRIESGYARLNEAPAQWTDAEVELANTRAQAKALARHQLSGLWTSALGTSALGTSATGMSATGMSAPDTSALRTSVPGMHSALQRRGLIEELRVRPQTVQQTFAYRRPHRQTAVRGAAVASAALVARGTALALASGADCGRSRRHRHCDCCRHRDRYAQIAAPQLEDPSPWR